MDVDSDARRAGEPAAAGEPVAGLAAHGEPAAAGGSAAGGTAPGEPAAPGGRRHKWKRFLERASGLQIMAVYWAPLTLLIGLPLRWLFDRQEPLVEAALGAALNTIWIGLSIYLTQRILGDARPDPEGYALREAVRTGTVPEDEATRAALPGYLTEQRKATWAALLVILGVCLGLVLLALLVAHSEGFAVIFGVVAAVSVGVAALTLTRIRRLASLPAVPNPPALPE